MSAKMWGGRFAQETDALVNRFNSSIGFDHKLHAYDVDGSIAHCRVLAKKEIITEEEAVVMIEALAQIRRELERGQFSFTDGHEDIHSMVEEILVDKIGPLGEKVHTGRSRNDQVALDVRMYVRDAVQQVMTLIKTNQIALVALADKNMDVIMPGYTHMQRA
ncbi:MAG: lyase family protein, partial [Gammaproteobacteria bacterium]